MLVTAVQNSAILRRLAQEPPPASVAAFAAEFGRDADNFRKTLALLSREGLTEATPGRVPVLSDAARELLPRLDVLEGAPLPGGAETTLRHAQLTPDPDQPRKTFGAGELRALADTIGEKGLLQPILAQPPGEDMLAMIIDGERRWRAIGLLIEDGAWPDDRPVPVAFRAMDPADARVAQLIANLQREDVPPLEEAETLQGILDTRPELSQRDVARMLGRSEAWLRSRLALLSLPDTAKEALGEGLITVEAARQMGADMRQVERDRPAVSAPGVREPFTPSPQARMVLVELADKQLRQPETIGGYGYAQIVAGTRNKIANSLVAEGAMAMRFAGLMWFARVADFGERWLTEQGLWPEGDNREHALETVYQAVEDADGSTIDGALLDDCTYVTDWLNTDAKGAAPAAKPVSPLVGDEFSNLMRQAREEPEEPAAPALLPPTDEEQAQIAAKLAAEQAALADNVLVDRFASDLRERLAEWRARAYDGLDPRRASTGKLAETLVGKVEGGDVLAACAFAMFLRARAGAMGAGHAVLSAVGRDERPSPENPAAALYDAADALRDIMLRHYEALSPLPGVEDAYTRLASAMNDVIFDDARAERKRLAAAIRLEG